MSSYWAPFPVVPNIITLLYNKLTFFENYFNSSTVSIIFFIWQHLNSSIKAHSFVGTIGCYLPTY